MFHFPPSASKHDCIWVVGSLGIYKWAWGWSNLATLWLNLPISWVLLTPFFVNSFDLVFLPWISSSFVSLSCSSCLKVSGAIDLLVFPVLIQPITGLEVHQWLLFSFLIIDLMQRLFSYLFCCTFAKPCNVEWVVCVSIFEVIPKICKVLLGAQPTP